MKKFFTLLIILSTTFSINSQNNYYGSYHNLIKNQQKEILKKIGVKKMIIKHYRNSFLGRKKLIKRVVIFDKNGKIENLTYESYFKKEAYNYTYNKANLLITENIKIKNGPFNSFSKPMIYAFFKKTSYPNLITYSYDKKDNLVQKIFYENKNLFRSEKIEYKENKIFTSYSNSDKKLQWRKVLEKKDSIEIILKINKDNNIESKTIIYYDIDSLKLKEQRFRKDTLVYEELNKFHNKRIMQSKKSFFKNRKNLNFSKNAINLVNYSYNKNFSLKKTLHIDGFNRKWRNEFEYNKQGLLILIKTFLFEELFYTSKFSYKTH